ncbi:MAG: periplasmic protein TonB [Sphingomonadales bacterium]|nr:periplasmic protein TonB [Sphingomonadales bacterium]
MLALSLLAAPAAGAAARAPASSAAAPARTSTSLATLFSDEDYPAAALRNHEQGAVAFSLYIGPDGNPIACSVTASSGSALLDSTTCRLLMERARFQPARDAKGKPTTDSYAGRIVWRLPNDGAPPAVLLWTSCVSGEASKLVLGDLPPAEVARRAFGPCAALEALAGRGPGAGMSMPERRAALSHLIEADVPKIREQLKASPAAPKAP